MEIHVAPLLFHLFIIGSFYSIFWILYRFILHPEYRWSQRGNICYDDARYFASVLTGVFYTLFLLFYYGNLKLIW